MPEERSLYLFASVLSAAIFGVEVCPVQVEADVSNGLPSFIMVGFPSAQVKEAQERVRTALKNNGYQFPPKRITVNFAPADMKKEGAGFDVPVAAAVLAAFEMISPQVVSRVMMAGEIGLDGEIHGISGILPIVLCARSLGSRFCVVPYENLKEGRLIRDVPVAGVKNLRELVECLKNPEPYLKREIQEEIPSIINTDMGMDFSDIEGQEGAKRAAEIAVSGFHNLLLIGPPGTGKTTTLVEAIYETLHREPQVLVCAQSNMAVDWISEKLVDRGVNVLRIGNPTRVNDKMLSFTYERRFENHPLYPELWSIRKELRQLGGRARRGSYDEREGIRSRMSRLRDRATALEVQINTELFDSAHVIASTLVSSNHRLLNGRRFGTLFIDEAAQALEAACWIAIRKADRVVLAGDHCQLPPTIKCYEAARGGLERTLMEKVAANKPSAVSLLKVQYRMHEDIMRFSSNWFYDGELEAAPEIRHRGILDWDTPVTWIDTSDMDFKEEFVGETFGRINKEEAHLLLKELEAYILRIGGSRILEERIDFGLISPYKAQVQYLRGKIKGSATLRPYRSLITVNTVDGFQGQERDVIFISLVRANEEGQIGFLNDLRRMNVAITRARMKLVILGEAATLGHHAFYKQLLEYVKKVNGRQ